VARNVANFAAQRGHSPFDTSRETANSGVSGQTDSKEIETKTATHTKSNNNKDHSKLERR